MKRFDKIYKYMFNEMSAEEKLNFETEKASDPRLKTDTELAIEILETLKDQKARDFRKKVKEIISSANPDKNVLRLMLPKQVVLKWAASIAILLGVSAMLTWYFASTKNKYDKVFSQYYETYPLDFLNRSDGNVFSNLYMAFTAYEEKKYDVSLSLFNKVIEEDSTILVAYFYRGIASIETDNIPLAIESFNKVLQNNENAYITQSHWYSALSFVRLKDKNKAIAHLNWLKSNDRYYGKKAEIILKELN